LWKWFSKSDKDKEKEKEKPEAKKQQSSYSRHGSLRVEGEKIVVTDPEKGGSFPILMPSPGVIIRMNGQVLEAPSPVSSADDLTWSLATEDNSAFFAVSVADDLMSAQVEIFADPNWFTDGASVEAVSETEFGLAPGIVGKNRKRPLDPAVAIKEALKEKNVTFGLLEETIGAHVKKAADEGWRGSWVVARGQDAVEPVPDRWEWPSAQGLCTPGQVIGFFQKGSPNVPETLVTGEQRFKYPHPNEARVETGAGIRILPTNQAVATRRGLLRVTTNMDGSMVADVVDAHVIEGELGQGQVLQTDKDVAVTGDVTKAKIETTGAVLIVGKAYEAEISGHTIEVLGKAEGCLLCTTPKGNAVVVAGILKILLKQLQDLAAGPGDFLTPFRRAQGFLRYLSEMLRGLPTMEPEMGQMMANITRVLMAGPEASGPAKVKELAAELERFCGVREARAMHAGDVLLRSGSTRNQVWSGRNVTVEGGAVSGSQLFAAKEIVCDGGSLVVQSELMSGRGAVLKRGTGKGRPVTIRSGGRVQIGEAAAGTIVEIGGQAYTFKAEMMGVTIGLTTKYEIAVRRDG
jgi:hypothetical protein